MEPPKLIARIGGGLGNQMFNYAVGLGLALRTGRRLVLDLSEFAVMRGRAYGLDAFAGPASCPRTGKTLFAALAADRALQRVSKPFAARTLALLGLEWFKNDDMLETGAVTAMLERLARHPANGRTPYLTGCYSLMSFFPPRKTVCDAFKRADAPSSPNKGGGATGHAGNDVSVHIRRGDYLTLQGSGIQLPLAYYESAIAEMRRLVRVERWVVFSDDIDWCRGALGRLFAEPVEFARGDTVHPAADLMRMASCRHHIIANSTFSWWGAYLSAGDGVTLYPEPWFAGYRLVPGIHAPESWRAVPRAV